MNLRILFDQKLPDIEIAGIATDTRFVKPGFLFIPLPGEKFSGFEFLPEAIVNGASAAVLTKPFPPAAIPIIVTKDAKAELLRLLLTFYGRPDRELLTIGITGTDGKTTTASITRYLLNFLIPTAYIGTNGIAFFEKFMPNRFTTLLLSENYRLLREFIKAGIKAAALEVSSEGIVGGRIEGLGFDYAVFTNLSHEHLNTHLNLENYFQAKARLFQQLKPNGLGIINNDDALAGRFKGMAHILTFGIDKRADFTATNLRYGKRFLTFDLMNDTYNLKNLKLNRLEKYNLYNALPAIIIALRSGMDPHLMAEKLQTIPIVTGRLEKIKTRNGIEVYIDFAHTPNALANVLATLRKRTKNNLIVVCGAAGNKDSSKRPLMGQIACNLADYVIFTSEDPKDEAPLEIIDQLSQAVEKQNYLKVLDRFEAINISLKMAVPGDTVIVTGKGRETTYEEKGVIRPYSDYDSIIKILENKK